VVVWLARDLIEVPTAYKMRDALIRHEADVHERGWHREEAGVDVGNALSEVLFLGLSERVAMMNLVQRHDEMLGLEDFKDMAV